MHSPLSGLRPCCARALKAAIAALFIFLAVRGAAAQEINPWKPSGTVYWIASRLAFSSTTGGPARRFASGQGFRPFYAGPLRCPVERHEGRHLQRRAAGHPDA